MALAIDATVDFELTGGHLTTTYTFSEDLDEVSFSYGTDEEHLQVFQQFSKRVGGTRLQLKTVKLEDLLSGSESPVFSHDNGNTLVYSPFFDVTHGRYRGQTVAINRLEYRFQGKTLHTRLLSEDDAGERYLVLMNNSQSVHRSVHADIILDDDIPNKELILSKIERSLTYLTEKLGPPKERPTVFFSYSSSNVPWYDGRVVIGSPVVMLAMSKGLEEDKNLYNVVLHHAMLSHEIAHHWNARNLHGNARTQEESDASAWIHEGGAEAIAHLMTKDLFAEEMGEFVSYMRTDNGRQCETPDADAAWEYNCGDVMYGLALGAPGVDPWKVIKQIMNLPAVSEGLVFLMFARNAGQQVLDQIVRIHATRSASH